MTDEPFEGLAPVQGTFPEKLMPLFEAHRYKVLHGGRNGMKTYNISKALLYLGANQPLRILCTREVQRSIRDSVHEELRRMIDREGLGDFYTILDQEIRGINGTEFIFSGLNDQAADSIKSYSSVDICWVEEARGVSKHSWDTLTKTIRAPGSEIWISFNPGLDTEETYVRFVVNQSQFDDIVVIKTTYADNPWLSQEQEAERRRDELYDPDYENIWEGVPRSSVEGAVYAREIRTMFEEQRIRAVPYDPRCPVHTVWDLGWNDRMCVIFFQKPMFNAINVINYMEDSFKRYDEYIADMERFNYRWGTDYLPHDAANKDAKTGMSTAQVFRRLGRRHVVIIGRGDIEDGIRKARMLFPRIYIDDTKRKVLGTARLLTGSTGYKGTERLLECLRRYRRKGGVENPDGTREGAKPAHDEHSHAADAFRYLAMIADRVHNDGDEPAPRVRGWTGSTSGLGMLG